VTICAHNRECLLGEIVDAEMRLNRWGHVAAEWWQWLERRYPHVTLDEWIIMPNHIHGIILLGRGDMRYECKAGSRTAPTTAQNPRKPLGRLIGAFKTVSTKRINEIRGTPGARLWQRNYYEHVIRNEKALDAIRTYIWTNPSQRTRDPDNPDSGL